MVITNCGRSAALTANCVMNLRPTPLWFLQLTILFRWSLITVKSFGLVFDIYSQNFFFSFMITLSGSTFSVNFSSCLTVSDTQVAMAYDSRSPAMSEIDSTGPALDGSNFLSDQARNALISEWQLSLRVSDAGDTEPQTWPRLFIPF